MIDFSLEIFRLLIEKFISAGYQFQNFQDFLISPLEHLLILRHDVDLLPYNSLKTSKIEYDLDIKGTYYFRVITENFDEAIIEEVARRGHEIGYHYEDVDLAFKSQKSKGKRKKFYGEELIDLAYESFCENLEKFRKIYPVKTICMHGSPFSPFDNKIIWKKYDYKELGIIGEPYFDIDFNEVFYLTDTGRRWDGEEVSVRDKVQDKRKKEKGKRKEASPGGVALMQEDEGNCVNNIGITLDEKSGLRFRHTWDIIKAAEEGRLPDKMMITIHPQRWHDSFAPWLKELVWQNAKNVIKKYYFVNR